MAKKDFKAAAAHGAEVFFSYADDTNNTDNTQSTQDTRKAHRAQDEDPAQLKQTIQDMSDAIEVDEAERQERKRRKADEKRINICITTAGYEYCKIMGSITGKGISRFISDLIEREATTNDETYKKAKELIRNARS